MGRLAQLHGQRENLERIVTRSDVLICATGAPRLIPPERLRSKGQIVFALDTRPGDRSGQPPSPPVRPSPRTAEASAMSYVSPDCSMERCAAARGASRRPCSKPRLRRSPPQQHRGNYSPTRWTLVSTSASRRRCNPPPYPDRKESESPRLTQPTVHIVISRFQRVAILTRRLFTRRARGRRLNALPLRQTRSTYRSSWHSHK